MSSSPYADLAPLVGPDRQWLSLFVDVTDRPELDDVAIERLAGLAADAGATDALVAAARDELRLPLPDDVGGRAVFIGDDGTVHCEDGPDGPGVDRAFLGPLPRLGPVLEWRQSTLDHAVITVAPGLVELVRFPSDDEESLTSLGRSPDEALDRLREQPVLDLDLVVVAGDLRETDHLRRALVDVLPATTDIRPAEDGVPLADSVVRLVADTAARRTIGALNEFRFQKTHDAAVDGADDVVDALAAGRGDLLLVHDDPDDDRTVWFGPGSSDISMAVGATTPTEGRLVDAAIRVALRQDMAIRVIPSTGERGPRGDIAVVSRDPATTV